MNEQIGHQYRRTRNGQQDIQRRTKSQNYQKTPANPHRVGHEAGLHPEDYPYLTTDQVPISRQGFATSNRGNIEELEEDDRYYETRPPTSARRYNTIQDGQVFQQGNKRIIVHYEEPPPMQRRKSSGRNEEKHQHVKFHPLLVVGIFLMLLFAGLIGITALGSWWQTKQDDWTYGMSPRTYQTDANVGHGTPQNPLSHFIAFNLKGQIEVIELPGGDASKAKSYEITVIPDNQGNPPVKVVFQDLNRDGKLDMLVEIGDPGSYITIMLFNNGTEFVSKL